MNPEEKETKKFIDISNFEFEKGFDMNELESHKQKMRDVFDYIDYE